MNLTNGKFYALHSFPVAKFIDSVRELKPALIGVKGGHDSYPLSPHFNTALKLTLIYRTGSKKSATGIYNIKNTMLYRYRI